MFLVKIKFRNMLYNILYNYFEEKLNWDKWTPELKWIGKIVIQPWNNNIRIIYKIVYNF